MRKINFICSLNFILLTLLSSSCSKGTISKIVNDNIYDQDCTICHDKLSQSIIHKPHITKGNITTGLSCFECHPFDFDHSKTTEKIQFGDVAKLGNSNPIYEEATKTCSNVYCHGTTLVSSQAEFMIWSATNSLECSGCHGAPPSSHQQSSTNCFDCHKLTVSQDSSIITENNTHIDGSIQLNYSGAIVCNACHGSINNPAPPNDVRGNQNVTDITVGLHQLHVTNNPFREALNCNECHLTPTNVTDSGHIDSVKNAEITWGTLSQKNGANPSWNRSTGNCSNIYCHGDTIGGSASNFIWTENKSLDCTSCHGFPPAAPHPQNPNCSGCHGQTVDSSNNNVILTANKTHIDGSIQMQYSNSLSCNSCHGNVNNDAPPSNNSGSSNIADLSVGVHQAHLTNNPFRAPLSCTECHIVPVNVTDSNHIDGDQIAEVIFGTLATGTRATPIWDRITGTCSNVYCHNPTVSTKLNPAPPIVQSVDLWTKEKTLNCTDSCHGFPPLPPHPDPVQGTEHCYQCHTLTVSQTDNRIVEVGNNMHINGSVEVFEHSVHKNPRGQTPAPEDDLKGKCNNCHAVADIKDYSYNCSFACHTPQIYPTE